MCCGFAFWKKALVFGLTLGFGVFVSNMFTLRSATSVSCPLKIMETPAENQRFENKSVSETTKCVPVDKNLKYERLTTGEQSKPELQKQTDKKKLLKENKVKQRKSFKPENPLFKSSKDSAEYETLLHTEQCHESNGRK